MNTTSPNRRQATIFVYLLFIAAIAMLGLFMSRCNTQNKEMSYTDYLKKVEASEIHEVKIYQNEEVPTGQVVFALTEGSTTTTYTVAVSDVNAEQARLLEKKARITIMDVPGEAVFLTTILPMIIMVAGMILIFVLMNSRMNAASGGGSMADFGKSKANISDPATNPIRFSNVAGLQEEKEELMEVVDFLKNPGKYLQMGARIPKGVLLVGPPGTGKTLLAKAVAGEAGVPFFTISGSDFVEMFVGVGASRVRDLFDTAKENAPCIVFIDEIDAVGRHRGSGLGGGHDEREQTLNQLLVEMDGFTVNEGIIVMAATNRADILDHALLRPGRFDRKVAVGRPDVKGREEILTVHAREKKMADDVDLKRVAQTTAGFVGADLENLLNEAAINAARKDEPYITQQDIDEAFVKVGIGAEKKSRVISEKEKKITAYHEMGHAILFEALPDVGPVHTVSIIPTGVGAAGYTMPLPESDQEFLTRGRMLQEIMVAMGGRIAEELTFGDYTTGASEDIRQATDTARSMVMKYGMSDKIGFMNYEQTQDEIYLGRDLGHMKTYGSDIINVIEAEVKRIIDDCYSKAAAIIQEKKDILDAGAHLLMEKEKINQQEFEAVYYGREAAPAEA